jgi:unsaturated rhamnogalacturonyl hydrolase
MKRSASKKGHKKGWITVFVLLLSGLIIQAQPQTRVILDNYFNHEINAKTGKVFHYTWPDKASSGFSEWGDIFKDKGADIAALQQAPRKADLAGADIYIIVDPDTKAETSSPHYIGKKDIRAIVKWVKGGGVLVLMANDSGNCEFQHLNNLAKKAGMHFNEASLNHVTGKHWEMGAITDLPKSPVFAGVHKIYLKEVSSLTLRQPARAVLTKDGNVFMAESHVGKGYVFAVTDPWIYNEYIGHRNLPESFENHQAADNFSAYLITLSKKGRSNQ